MKYSDKYLDENGRAVGASPFPPGGVNPIPGIGLIPRTLPAIQAPPQRREAFVVPPGHEAVRDAEGRATGETRPKTALSTQVGGTHYTDMPIQPFQYSMANKLDPMQHTIIKYVTRFRGKGGLKDLQKARHTIDLLIENDYGVQGN